VASNIDAGTHVYLHEFWFKQKFRKFVITIGLQDLNADFLASENAGNFINSSFGIPPVVSCNMPVPIFPLTGLGVSAQWSINDNFIWQSAVFDGCQTDFENNPHNLHWKFSKDDGVFIATEFHSKFNIKEKEGTYKLGAYYHSGLCEFDEEIQIKNTIFKNNYGFYFIADQTVFEQGNRKIGLFMQVAATSKSKNEHSRYLGFGGNYYGIFNKNGKDVLGLAIASIDLQRNSHKHETALELYYKWQFNDNFAIQPDIQYIINPSDTDAKLCNALVGILRLHINF
jgi:porin